MNARWRKRRGQGSRSFSDACSIRAIVQILEDRTLFNSLVWAAGPALPAATANAASLNSYGLFYVIGGTSSGAPTANAYTFDPFTGQWNTALQLDQARSGAGAGTTGYAGSGFSSTLFVFGGDTGGQATASNLNWVDSNNIDGNSASAAPMSAARANVAYATDPILGNLYAIGGESGGTALSSAEAYNVAANTWSPIAPLPQAVYSAAAVNDGVGHIFVIGGDNSAGQPLNTVYRYTIATDSWDTMGAMPFAASGVGAVYAAYGQIYVVGGQTANGPTASVEWYDPVLDQWNNETPLPAAVSGAAVGIDGAGNVDVAGGFNAAGQTVSTFFTSPVGPAPVGLPATPTLTFNGAIDNPPIVTGYYNGAPQGVIPEALASDGVTPVAGSYTVTYNGSTTLPTNAGVYNMVATFTSADPNYTNTVVSGSFTIAPALPQITLTGGGTILWDGNPHPVTATVVGVDGVTPPAGSLVVTYNGSTAAPVNGGTYNVVATFTSSDPNYYNATATTTITIPDPTIPTGVTTTGVSPTSFSISWNPVPTPVEGYDVIHVVTVATHTPKGSGGTSHTYYYVVAFTTGTTVTLGTPGTYCVSSVSTTGVMSPYSAEVVTQNASPPTIYGMLVGGAFVAWANVEAGQTVTSSLDTYGSPSPTYSMLSGPSTMSIDPNTGIITYSPTSAEVGYNYATFQASNSQGSATITCEFHVLAIPTIVVTGGTFTFDGNTHGATAVALGTDGVTPVAGNFFFTYGIYGSTAPYESAGSYPVSVTFVSTDSNYGNASGTGLVVINPATTAFTLTGGSYNFDGTPHAAVASAIGIDGVTPVNGVTSITYNGSPNVPTAPGTYNVSATFTSSDADYTNATATTTLTIIPPVVQVTPTVLVSNDTYTYTGQAESASSVEAVAADGVTQVNGSYAVTYNGSATLPTDAGTYEVDVAFTSADPNFTNANGVGTLTILPTTPTVSLPNNTIVFNGKAHPAAATEVGVDGVTPVAGSFSYTYNGSANVPMNAGTYSVIATFTSTDPDYGGATANATLTINPATPTFTVQGGSVTFNGSPQGATSTAIGVDGVTPVAGTASYTYNGSKTVPTNAGTYTIAGTFTSSDPNYFNSSGTATLVINKAVPTVTLTTGTFAYTGAARSAVATQVGVDGLTPVAGRMAITYNGSTTAPVNAGTYTVVATFTSSNTNYANASATGILVINKLTPAFSNLSSPTILAGASTTTLSGTLAAGTIYPSGSTVSITLNGTTKTATVSSTGAFSASFTTSTLAATGSPYAISYSFAGSTNFAAATGAGTLTITSNPPIITTSPTSQTVVSGKTVTFTAAASGTPTPTVQWQFSTNGGSTWTNISGATKTTYSFTAAASQSGYQYRAVFSSVGGTATTSAATLTVQVAPAVTTSPTSQTVVAGKNVTFTAAASGNPTPTVQWQVSTNGGSTWTNISGATSTTLTFAPTSSQNGYLYRAVFTSSAGTATTSSATLTVQYAPVVSINPLSQTVTPGTSVTFTAAATGNPTPTVQWQVSTNGGTTWTNISGATKTSYTLTATITQNGYRYRAVFTNSVSSTTTSVAILTT